jgi:hypothetical protein
VTVFDLRGTADQNRLVTEALALADFPWEWLLPGLAKEGKEKIAVDWKDLSRFGQAAVSARAGAGHDGEHEHDVVTPEGRATPIEREVEGRRAVLGLFYLPPFTRIVLHTGLVTRPKLAHEVFLAEAWHGVDLLYMTNAHRVAVVNAVHEQSLPEGYVVKDGVPLGLDGHACGWFDVGPYEWWVGETVMALLSASFAPTVPNTIKLRHPVTRKAATRVRYALVGPDLFGTKSGKAYHRASCPFIRASWRRHKTTWATPEDAALAGRRACRVCRPPVTSWEPL